IVLALTVAMFVIAYVIGSGSHVSTPDRGWEEKAKPTVWSFVCPFSTKNISAVIGKEEDDKMVALVADAIECELALFLFQKKKLWEKTKDNAFLYLPPDAINEAAQFQKKLKVEDNAIWQKAFDKFEQHLSWYQLSYLESYWGFITPKSSLKTRQSANGEKAQY
ncbi:hypothetical protein RFI_15012, partial [Reticulomyxa filosa]